MDKINVLTSVLEGGVAPDNYDGKVVSPRRHHRIVSDFSDFQLIDQ